jgi:23S rRNA pseudouridine1911/1915/1917 synthase
LIPFSAQQILFEDNHLMAINKAAGQIVQGDKSGDAPIHELVKEFIKVRDNKPGNVFAGVIHRLDRPVSGVLLLAKTSKALERMNEQFRNKDTQKTYWAIVKNRPDQESGTIRSWLIKNEQKNMSRSVNKEIPGAREAVTHYKLLASSDTYHLLEVQIETGRHHQIRVHLSAIGCPIKGDLKYGAERSNPDGSISLHSRRLAFIHPVRKEPVSVIGPVPDDRLWQWFQERGV